MKKTYCERNRTFDNHQNVVMCKCWGGMVEKQLVFLLSFLSLAPFPACVIW